MTNAILTTIIFSGLLRMAQPVEDIYHQNGLNGGSPYVAPPPPVLDHDLFYPFGATHANYDTDEEPTPKPFIDPSTPTNVTVIKGKSAMLACVVRNVGKAAVSWMRMSDINLLAINEVTNTKDKRIKAIHVPDSERWSLRIQDTQLSDDGAYECQVTTDAQTATVVHLKVLDPQTEIVGPPEVFLSKGSTLNLTCIIRNGPAQQPFIIWTHNSQMLKYVGGQEKQSLTSTEADLQLHPVISTRIVVTDTDVQHSGTYKCEPGAAPVASVNVHVLDGKLPAAMQTAGVGTHLHRWLATLLGLHVAYCILQPIIWSQA